MATKTTKKSTKDSLLAPVKYKKVENKEDEKEIKDILSDSVQEFEGVVEPEYVMSSNETVQEKPAVKEKPETMEELIGALGEIDKAFEGVTDRDYYPESSKVDIPPSLDLEKMEVPEIDEEKIGEEVFKEESEKVQTKKDNLLTSTENKAQAKKDEIEEKKLASEREREEIKSIYDDYKVSVESDAIKRGLARSSVALLSIEGVEAGRAKELSRVAQDLTSSISSIENEILKLQQDLDSSLSALDLELAENINEKIKKRIDELEDKRNDAIKFNNQVNEMEAEYQMKRLESVDEATALEEELQKKYEGFAENDKREKKVEMALSYFSSMDKTSALAAIISSPELAAALGNAYYDIYYYTMRR